MLEDRRLDVLRAIVEEFVSSHEPVGSKLLTERRQLGVSPATVRNDMAALEDDGYITQPHTSAGRVPTDKGYRLFVDRLSTVKPLSVAERRAIQSFLEGASDPEDVLRRSVRLLASLTRQVAVVQYPVLARSSVRHIELVELGSSRLLLVLITDTGRVEQRVIEAPYAVDDAAVTEVRTLINGSLAGSRLVDAPSRLAELTEVSEQSRPSLRPLVAVVVATLLEAVVERPDDRIMLAGTANLTRHSADFPGSLRPVLEALEEQVVLLKLIGAAETGGVTVSIGAENDVAELKETSIVRTGYGTPEGAALAGIGVLGPTRMDYPATIAQVRAVASYVGELLAGAPRLDAAGEARTRG